MLFSSLYNAPITDRKNERVYGEEKFKMVKNG